ncbi:MAG: aspartate carbamoyltransferase catalytic subunit [Planctomycetes bacterium]|nr:aspartate carbamoyltransferase catalytic subunit [Planctomycetota bacterium]MBI3845046.1 aspartate carbamoyltransferase catalytic subunit [Planctomycetota bacterium]
MSATRKRDLVSIDDLTNAEIEGLFTLADEMAADRKAVRDLARGLILVTLFYEPSTRTRLSFEAAMLRLGGSYQSCPNMDDTSAAKGESLADTLRVVGRYGDVVVLRHPREGASRVAARYSPVPIVNAGDGGREHPTQTLIDLYTIARDKRKLDGLCVAFTGDLRYGRTVHSLAYALARFGADIVCLPAKGLELPHHVVRRLETDFGCFPVKLTPADLKGAFEKTEGLLLTAGRPFQPDLFSNAERRSAIQRRLAHVDVLYVTRVQKERLKGEAVGDLPVIDLALLSENRFRNALVLHPLPRVNEIACEVDDDPRARYFTQVERGVPVRMAILAHVLGLKDLVVVEKSAKRRAAPPLYRSDVGLHCPSPGCITATELGYLTPEFHVLERRPLRLRCAFCDFLVEPRWVASRHERVFHRFDSPHSAKIHLENLVIFGSVDEAKRAGFEPADLAEIER